MKVEVTFTEEWQRKKVIDVDEAEVRQWAAESPALEPLGESIPPQVVQEFLEATVWDPVAPWLEDASYHTDPDADFWGDDVQSVKVLG